MEAQAQYTIVSVYDGKDGLSVSTILYYYLATDTPNVPDASMITSETMPATSPDKRYLWKKSVTVFSDPEKEDIVSIDLISVYGDKGASPYILVLAQDNFVFTADSTGTVSANQLTTITSAIIYHGNTEEDISTWTLSGTFQPSARFAGSVSSTGQISVSKFDAQADIGYITVTATKGDITLTKVLRCTKSKQGAQGDKGDTEIFRIACSPSSPGSDFVYSWHGNASGSSVILELQNTVSGVTPAWSATAGGEDVSSIIQAVSGNANQRNITLDGVLDTVRAKVMASPCVIVTVSAVLNGKTYAASYEIRNIYEAMPAPIYCGTYTSLTATNSNRESGYFADGDFMLYIGPTTTSSLISNSDVVTYLSIYEYDYATKLWAESNTPQHAFAALSDLLVYDNAGHGAKAIEIVKMLVASAIVADNITVNSANVKGKISVSQLSTQKEDGSEGINITPSEISGSDSEGKKSWSFRSDGSATLTNVNISGTVSATNVDHEALKTVQGTSLSAASNVQNWTAPADTYTEADAYAYASKTYHPISWAGYSYLSKACDIACFGNGVPSPDISTESTGQQTKGQAMAVGTRYKNSKNVPANTGAWNINPLKNNYSYPVYVKASCSLSGNMNDIYIEFWNQYDSPTKLQKGRSWSGWIMPGQLVGVYGHSWAWWGNQTGSGQIEAYENDGEPYLGYQKFAEYAEAIAPNTQSTAKQYVKMFDLTLPAGTRIVRLFAVNTSLGTNNNTVCIGYGSGTPQYIYKYATASNGDYLFDLSGIDISSTPIWISADINPVYNSGGEDEDPYYNNYSINMRMISVFYYHSFNGIRRCMVRSTSGEVQYILPTDGTDPNTYHIQSAEPSTIPGFTSSSYLYYVSGDSVIAKLASIGIGYGKTVECSTTATSSATFTSVVESKQYSISSLVNVTLNSNRLQFYKSGTESQHIYAKGQGDNANIGVYSSVNLRLYLVGGNTRIQTQQIVPFADNTYSIGTSTNKYKEFFSYSANINSLSSGNAEITGELNVTGTSKGNILNSYTVILDTTSFTGTVTLPYSITDYKYIFMLLEYGSNGQHFIPIMSPSKYAVERFSSGSRRVVFTTDTLYCAFYFGSSTSLTLYNSNLGSASNKRVLLVGIN